MTQTQRDEIKQKIDDDIAHLKIQIKELEEKTKPIEPDCGLGRLTRMEAIAEKSVNDSILEQSKLTLGRLINSKVRVDREEFGICIECEDDIAIGRMMIRPQSIRCVDCASKREQR